MAKDFGLSAGPPRSTASCSGRNLVVRENSSLSLSELYGVQVTVFAKKKQNQSAKRIVVKRPRKKLSANYYEVLTLMTALS